MVQLLYYIAPSYGNERIFIVHFPGDSLYFIVLSIVHLFGCKKGKYSTFQTSTCLAPEGWERKLLRFFASITKKASITPVILMAPSFWVTIVYPCFHGSLFATFTQVLPKARIAGVDSPSKSFPRNLVLSKSDIRFSTIPCTLRAPSQPVAPPSHIRNFLSLPVHRMPTMTMYCPRDICLTRLNIVILYLKRVNSSC